MHQRLSILFFTFCVLSYSLGYAQQRSLYGAERQKTLQNLSESLGQRFEQNYRLALRQARRQNWPLTFRTREGGKAVLIGLSETGEPLYVRTLSNVAAARTTHTTDLRAGGSLGLNLTGSSTALNGRLGIWDGDAVRATHQELTGRVTQQDRVTEVGDHPTHVSGTMIASGVNPIAQGMAPGANLKAWDFNNDASEMATAASSLLLSNHSYGTIAGWEYDDEGNLTWYGDDNVSQTEDYKFGFYNSVTVALDRLTFNAPYYLPVFSSGNSRGTSGPAAGTSYNLSNGRTSTLPRRPNGVFDNIGYYGTAKNVLTVGAVDVVPGGVIAGSQLQLAGFSSTGPTDDGRIKPDVVGAGVNIYSSVSTNDSAYGILSGTSMAAPNVTGSLLLLQELYQQRNNGNFIRASTLKGLAIHTATDAGNTGPDYTYGWGVLDDRRAAQLILNADNNHLLLENSLAQGATFTRTVTASGNGPLLVTIAWTDPAGTASAATAANLNNRTPKLVNDLDVRVSDGTTTYQPWVLNPDDPTAFATTGDNIRDNVEQIYLGYAVPGKTYTITVTHKGTLTSGPQNYALLVSGIGSKTYCASAPSSDQDSRITGVVFGALTNTTSGCATYSDFTNKSVDVSVGQIIPLEITAGTCGADHSKIVKAYIDWNADGDFDDAGETLATSGVINGTNVYRTSVTVPSSVTLGYLTRLRLVLVETTNAADVNPCGTYGKGETQDYLVRIVRPANDVQVTSLVSPTDAFCENTGLVRVTVQNIGTAEQANVPVRVRVTNAQGAVVKEMTASTSLGSFEEATVTFPEALNLPEGQTFTFTVTTSLAGDQNPANDQLVANRTTSTQAAVTASAYLCGTDPTAHLVAPGATGAVSWYTSPTGGQPIAIGNAVSLTSVTAGQTLYAGLSNFSGTVGPATKSAFPGGGYNQFSPAVNVTTYVPLRLQSARLYIGHSGKITFTVQRADGSVINSVTLPVTATRTTPAPAAQPDDPNDPGAIYNLNLDIPQPGSYQIAIEYSDSATIYRNNNGVQGYPFTLPNIISITGNTAEPNPNTYYYYFYNLTVGPSGCTSEVRTPVTVESRTVQVQARIAPADSAFVCANGSTTLSAPTGTGLTYRWLRNGQVIAGATSATLVVTTAGSYQVTVIESGGCETTSTPTVVTVRTPVQPVITRNGLVLSSSLPNNNQWYLNGNPIAGATGQTYFVTQSGVYTVRNTQNGCVAESSAFSVPLSAEEQQQLTQSILTLAPNPASGPVTAIYQAPDETTRTVTVTIYTMQGQPLITRTLTRLNNRQYTYQFDSSVWAVGSYIVRLNDGSTTLTQRFVRY